MLGSFSASDFIPYIGWIIDWFTGLHGRRVRSVKDLDDFYEQMIDLHKEKKKQGKEDFVDLLLRMEKEEAVLGNDKLTRNHIKAILMNVLLAGIDTSAITMTWTMAELVRNPRVMRKVQSEIRNHMEKREMITLDDTDHFKYMKMVIKETWRLHPTTPLLLPREANMAGECVLQFTWGQQWLSLVWQICCIILTGSCQKTWPSKISTWKKLLG